MASHSFSSSKVPGGTVHDSGIQDEDEEELGALVNAINDLNDTLAQESPSCSKLHGVEQKNLATAPAGEASAADSSLDAVSSSIQVNSNSTATVSQISSGLANAAAVPLGPIGLADPATVPQDAIGIANPVTVPQSSSGLASTVPAATNTVMSAPGNAAFPAQPGSGAMLQVVTMANGQQQLLLLTPQQLQALQGGGQAVPNLLQSIQQQQQHMQLLVQSSAGLPPNSSAATTVPSSSSVSSSGLASSSQSSLKTLGLLNTAVLMPAAGTSGASTVTLPPMTSGVSTPPMVNVATSAASTFQATPEQGPLQTNVNSLKKVGGTKRASANGETDMSSNAPAPKKRRKSGEGTANTNKILTAYACFFREIQTEIRRQNPQATFADLSRTISQMWATLPEESRQVYHAQSELTKEEHDQAVKQQLAETQSTMTTEAQPSPSVSAPTVGMTTVSIAGTEVKPPLAANYILPTKGRPRKDSQNTNSSDTDASVKTAQAKTTRRRKQTICHSTTCSTAAVATEKRGPFYCSDECCIKHCREVFSQWVSSHRKGV